MEITGASHASTETTKPEGPLEIFESAFLCPDGHTITVNDSLAADPIMAMTLLKVVALPKDMKLLPKGKARNMAELCCLVAKVHYFCLFFNSFLKY